MENNNIIECGGFYFLHNFDSGNLGHVERVPTELIAPGLNHRSNAQETPDYEFNLWTRPDCAGTEFENGNRTWFYFGVQSNEPSALVRLNLINLNKQGKMYNQGMAPVTRTLPGKPQWERIRDRPVHSTDDNTFTLSFRFRTCENLKATIFFAFTYPYSFVELQIALNSIDVRMLPMAPPQCPDDIYYCRECLIYSLEGRRVDLLTISSHHGITSDREDRLKHLFPENQLRPFKFQNKKVIFISARVHPGETPSSFVFNGFLNLLLNRNDPIAVQLRKLYVFKMIPFLNPDGVARGHYRTDTRGVNLNRVYLNPSLVHHPTVYASRALIRYYHYGCETEDSFDDTKSFMTRSMHDISENAELVLPSTKKKRTGPLKGNEFNKREAKKPAQPLAGNKSILVSKSTTAVKVPMACSSDSAKKDGLRMNEAAHLAEQVCDMKLHEMTSQTSDCSKIELVSSSGDDSSLLSDATLKNCLGVSVHLSTSEELRLQGHNPLRPLRDTLKNSISLLMGSCSSMASNSVISPKESKHRAFLGGWCRQCRLAVDSLELTTPGIAQIVPGYAANSAVEFDPFAKMQSEEVVNFCTNCFKKYTTPEGDTGVEANPSDNVQKFSNTTANVAVSTGDMTRDMSAQVACPESKTIAVGTSAGPSADNSGDCLVLIQPKEEKVKLPPKSVKKKAAPVPPMPPVLSANPPAAQSTFANAVKPAPAQKELESGLYLYIDLHGHASKKGIFMYGNHFEDTESSVECMLLPRIMAMNNLHFHFSSCNFTERNMYLKDRRDGMSREGSGRVAVLKATGLVRSYTLECNYNTGRLVNVLPPPVRDSAAPSSQNAHHAPAAPSPPKYTPHIFEEVRTYHPKCYMEFFEEIDPKQVGRSLGASILDLTGHHPNSRLPGSEHRSLATLRDWLRAHARTSRPPPLMMSRLRSKQSPSRVPLYARSKGKVTEERKENAYAGAKSDLERRRSPTEANSSHQPALTPRSGHEPKYAKKEPKSASRSKYAPSVASSAQEDSNGKVKVGKRHSVLAVRKPNSSKSRLDSARSQTSRRAEDGDHPRTGLASKLSKRTFSRSLRRDSTPRHHPSALASSSSSDTAIGWEDVAGGTALSSLAAPTKRRPFPNPSPARLKKIRLKSGL